MASLFPFLNQIDKKNVLSNVPENYFENFPEKVLSRIKAAETDNASEEIAILSPLLSKLDKKIPFSTPAGYFSELSDNLVGGMKAVDFVKDELENFSPVLRGIGNENVYKVPDGYFDHLAENILQKINQPQPGAKVISFKKRKSFMRYAVAAAVAGVILTIGVVNLNKPNITTTTIDDPAIGLSKISDQEITNYLDNNDIPLAETNPGNTTAMLDFNENDIKDFLNDVPDNELLQYANDQDDSKDLIIN